MIQDNHDDRLQPLSALLQKEAQAWNNCRSFVHGPKAKPGCVKIAKQQNPSQRSILVLASHVSTLTSRLVPALRCSILLTLLPFSSPAWYDRHATSCAGQPPPCDTAQSLSGHTPGSLDAFLAVEYWWVWLRRNVHHSLGLWNPPAQSAAPEACFPLITAKPPPTALRN